MYIKETNVAGIERCTSNIKTSIAKFYNLSLVLITFSHVIIIMKSKKLKPCIHYFINTNSVYLLIIIK